MNSVWTELFETPAGTMTAAWQDNDLVYAMVGSDAESALARWLAKHNLEAKPLPKPKLAKRLQAYFRGRQDAFDGLSIGFPYGTDFQRQVWNALLTIPFGQVWSYGELAHHIGRPLGARPVGQAVGANPVTIVVPCHRVVGSDQSLTGFGCGLPVKRVLLKNEGWALRRDKLVARQQALL
jgi:methylated-DNA-[protein]-cysteine S-methyltransferase